MIPGLLTVILLWECLWFTVPGLWTHRRRSQPNATTRECGSNTEQLITASTRNSCSLLSKRIYIKQASRSGTHNTISASRVAARRRHKHMAPICRLVLRKERRHLHVEMLYFCLTQNNLLKTQLVKSFQCGSENLIRRILICTAFKWAIVNGIEIVCNFPNWCKGTGAYCFTLDWCLLLYTGLVPTALHHTIPKIVSVLLNFQRYQVMS